MSRPHIRLRRWSTLCGLQLGMFIYGIVVLATGKAHLLGKNRPVVGDRARVLGVCLLVPFPLAFLIGFFYGMHIGDPGRMDQSLMLALDVGITVVGLLVVLGLAAYFHATPPPRRVETPYPDPYAQAGDQDQTPPLHM